VVVIDGTSPPAAGGSDALLECRGLIRRYGGRTVVDVDHLEIRAGEVVAVLGPNGAGKTTLFRLLLGLEAPDAGELRLAGRRYSAGDEWARRRLIGVFQDPHLFRGTVMDNLRFGLRATGVPPADWPGRIEAVVSRLGLAGLEGASVDRLSGGEGQRVALARALVLEPAVLMLDEPTANLDVTVRRRFREELAAVIRERAGGALLITHDPSDAFDLADRVAVMEAGRIVQTGTPDAVTTDPATAFVAAFTGAELLLDGVVARAEDGTVEVRVGSTNLVVRPPEVALSAGDRVHVRYRPEDVLLMAGDGAGISARNRLPMTVRSMKPVGGLVRVHLDGPVGLAAVVTRRSADSLGLAPGGPITALLKTSALSAYPADSSRRAADSSRPTPDASTHGDRVESRTD
jgi:molybdopterin-binding protein